MNAPRQSMQYNLGVTDIIVDILQMASDRFSSSLKNNIDDLELETYRICASLLYRTYQQHASLQLRASEYFSNGKLIKLLRLHIGMSNAIFFLLDGNKTLLMEKVDEKWVGELGMYELSFVF